MQNAAKKRSPCSARNSCELSPTWLMPVFFASSAAPAGGASATAALPPGTGFAVMSSIVSAPFASDRRDSIGGGTSAQSECAEPSESISFPANARNDNFDRHRLHDPRGYPAQPCLRKPGLL